MHQLASTPKVLVLMGERPVEVGLRPNGAYLQFMSMLIFRTGSRTITAAEEALAKFASDIRPTSTVVPVQLDIIDHTSIGAAHALLATTLIAGHPRPHKQVSLCKPPTVAFRLLLLTECSVALGTPSFKDTLAVNVTGTATVTAAMRPLLARGNAILNISWLPLDRVPHHLAQKASHPGVCSLREQ